jgi:hypothetical protein
VADVQSLSFASLVCHCAVKVSYHPGVPNWRAGLRKRLVHSLFVVLATVADNLLASPAQAQRRVALVICNGTCMETAPLANPRNHLVAR